MMDAPEVRSDSGSDSVHAYAYFRYKKQNFVQTKLDSLKQVTKIGIVSGFIKLKTEIGHGK